MDAIKTDPAHLKEGFRLNNVFLTHLAYHCEKKYIPPQMGVSPILTVQQVNK